MLYIKSQPHGLTDMYSYVLSSVHTYTCTCISYPVVLFSAQELAVCSSVVEVAVVLVVTELHGEELGVVSLVPDGSGGFTSDSVSLLEDGVVSSSSSNCDTSLVDIQFCQRCSVLLDTIMIDKQWLLIHNNTYIHV